MKIGIFTNAYKPIISGVVNSIDLIKRGLRELGHKVYIFAPRYPDYRDCEAGVFRFMSVNLTNQVKFPLAIPFSMRIFNIIERLKLDLIHTHHPFILGKLGANFSKKLGIPLVYTFHTQFEQYTHYVPLPQDILKMGVRTRILSYSEMCDMIICPSRTILSLLREYGVKTPIKMIPNAIDLERFKKSNPDNVRAKFNIGKNEKLLIYVGRMGLEKNLPFMLKAFKKVREYVEKARLMIVGEGPELESLEELKNSMGLGDRVIFSGRVEHADIPDYLSAGYAFVMTSTTEVKPLAILEAMASGLPIIAIAAAGSSDTVNQGFDGILTDHKLESFIEALMKLLEDDSMRNKLSQGALKTSENYSMTIIARELETLYKGLEKKEVEKYII